MGALRNYARLWLSDRSASRPWRWLKLPQDLDGNKVCIVASYSSDGAICEHTLIQTRAWKEEGYTVILAVNSADRERTVAGGIPTGVDAILVRENAGYDFGAWATTIVNLPALRRATRLILANDSLYGPVDGFAAFARALSETDVDLVGCTESLEIRRHYQSYILSFSSRAINSPAFSQFWSGIKVVDREQAIQHYEVKLLSYFEAAGMSCSVLYPADRSRAPYNPTLLNWRELIASGFPFVKAQVLRDPPCGVDVRGWRQLLSAHGLDPSVIDRHQALTGRRPVPDV